MSHQGDFWAACAQFGATDPLSSFYPRRSLAVPAPCTAPSTGSTEFIHTQKLFLARTENENSLLFFFFFPFPPTPKGSVLQKPMEPKKGIDNTSSTTHLIQLQFLIYQCQPPVQAFFGFHLFFYLHTVSGLPLLVATALIS